MYQDKKVKANQLNFVLLNKIGEGILVNNVNPENVKDVLLESLKKIWSTKPWMFRTVLFCRQNLNPIEMENLWCQS